MNPNPSSAAAPTPRTRRPQTRVDNGRSLVDLRVPASARRRRLTLANVSAVCEQLGEHVSTRNVQRALGGSLRDIGPLVQRWRENRVAASDAAAAAGHGDQAQAIGAILMGALQEHGAAVAAALQAQALANAATQQALFERVDRLLRDRLPEPARATPTRQRLDARRTEADGLKALQADLQGLRADVGRLLALTSALPATGHDPVELWSRIDRLTQAVDQLHAEQRIPPADGGIEAAIASALSVSAGDVGARLAPVIDRLEHLASAAPAPQPALPGIVPALDRIEAGLAALATPKPPARSRPSKAILTRLDSLLESTAQLPAKLKRAVTPQKPKPKPASRHATRKSALKTPVPRSASAAAKTKGLGSTRKSTAKKAATSARGNVMKPAMRSRVAATRKQSRVAVLGAPNKPVTKATKRPAAPKKAVHLNKKRTR